jgi:hypothetical protein
MNPSGSGLSFWEIAVSISFLIYLDCLYFPGSILVGYIHLEIYPFLLDFSAYLNLGF